MKTVERECMICGRKFTCNANSNQKVCKSADCHKALRRINRLRAIKQTRMEKELKKLKNSNLVNDAANAKRLGISYGEYKARQYQGIAWEVSKTMRRLEGAIYEK